MGAGPYANTFDSNLGPVKRTCASSEDFRARPAIAVWSDQQCWTAPRVHALLGPHIPRSVRAFNASVTPRELNKRCPEIGGAYSSHDGMEHIGRRGMSGPPGDLYAGWPLTICSIEIQTAKIQPSNMRAVTPFARTRLTSPREKTYLHIHPITPRCQSRSASRMPPTPARRTNPRPLLNRAVLARVHPYRTILIRPSSDRVWPS